MEILNKKRILMLACLIALSCLFSAGSVYAADDLVGHAPKGEAVTLVQREESRQAQESTKYWRISLKTGGYGSFQLGKNRSEEIHILLPRGMNLQTDDYDFLLEDPNKFDGWKITSGKADLSKADLSSYRSIKGVKPESDLVITAQWKNRVTLDTDGGAYFGEDIRAGSKNYYLKPGETLTVKKLGLHKIRSAKVKFLKWTVSEGELAAGSKLKTCSIKRITKLKVKGDLTLKASWKGTWAIRLDPKPGTWQMGAGDGVKVVRVAKGQKFDPNLYLGYNRPVIGGDYTMIGWSSSKTEPKIISEAYVPKENQTLYAVYGGDCNVTLDGNGGVFTRKDNVKSRTISVAEGVRICDDYADQPVAIPGNRGKIYTGLWSYQKDGSDPFSLKDYVPKEGDTLYAVYELKHNNK